MIQLNNVSNNFSKGNKGLTKVSLEILDGEFVYVTGKSGSGKSTLLKLLNKELESFTGSAFVNGWNLSKIQNKNIYKLRRDIGVVFQDFKLLEYLTAYDNIAYGLKVIGRTEKELDKLVMDALDLVDLSDKADAYPKELSGGEQQRVSIARAISKSPRILIADEPTANLNPKLALEIIRLFYRINQSGITVIMATHNWNIIHQFPRRVIELSEGKILSDRSREHIAMLTSADFYDLKKNIKKGH